MSKEVKYALYKISEPEDTFKVMTKHAYGMTDRRTGKTVWVPKSIVILDQPDELGQRKCHIPLWYFQKNKIAPEAICEGEYCGIVGLVI